MYIAGSILSSAITFVSVPIAIHFIGDVKFAQLSLWALFLILAQVLDFGLSQLTIKHCSAFSSQTQKLRVLNENNRVLILIVFLLVIFSVVVPRPPGSVYDSISEWEWALLKISAVLNIKVAFNQSALAVLNRQLSYTTWQIVLSLCRFILPILMFVISDNFLIVTLYFLISTCILIVAGDIFVGINYLQTRFSLQDVRIAAGKLANSLLLYLSACIAIVLSILDRFIASNIFDSSDYTFYFANFALASAVNIVVLPFYRIFVGKMRHGFDAYNWKHSLRITNVQSYICLFTIASLLLYSEYLISVIGFQFTVDVYLVATISISLWGAANGWIIATEIMMNRRPAMQAWLILSAMLCYAIYLALQADISVLDLSMIWVFHGLIQTLICPLWGRQKFSIQFYYIWLKYAVFIPFMMIFPMYLLADLISGWSIILSVCAFLLFGMVIYATMSRHSLIDSQFSKLI